MCSISVQHKLAELKTSIAVCRAFIDQCMELHDQARLGGEMASMAKYWSTDLENKVAADCLQLHGGWGFMWETQIAKCYAGESLRRCHCYQYQGCGKNLVLWAGSSIRGFWNYFRVYRTNYDTKRSLSGL